MARRGASLAVPLAVVGGLVARGLVLGELASHPLLAPDAGLDSGVYVDLARRVAGGDLLLRGIPEPFFVSPAYIYFLAAILFVTAGSLLAVKVVQLFLGTLAVALAAGTARRLFGERAAAPAAWLLALSGVVVFHETVLLQAALDPFLTALVLWLLARALEAPERPAPFLWAGLAAGALVLNRPNVLPWVALAATLIVAARGVKAGSRPAAALLLGGGLALLPSTVRNVVVSGEPVLVSSHGGLNLWIGNGPGADGTYRWLDGITPSIAGQAADARRVAEAEEGRTLSAGEVSRHFARKAWGWASSHPGDAARLFARKVWLVLSGDEIPLNYSVPWYRRESRFLWLLPVGPGLLVPLGAAGLLALVAGAGRLARGVGWVWASFAPAYVVLVALFFVSTRYRLPLLLALAPAAGGALVTLADALRKRAWRPLAAAAAVALPLAVVSLWPTGLDDGSAEEETQWVLQLIGQGEGREAARRLGVLAPRHPQPGLLWFRVGQAWAASGALDAAIPALERSLSLDGRRPETEKVLAAAHERRGIERTVAGNAEAAREDLEAAVRLDPASASARLNLAAVLAEKGELDRARGLAREALALRPGYDKAKALLETLAPPPATRTTSR